MQTIHSAMYLEMDRAAGRAGRRLNYRGSKSRGDILQEMAIKLLRSPEHRAWIRQRIDAGDLIEVRRYLGRMAENLYRDAARARRAQKRPPVDRRVDVEPETLVHHPDAMGPEAEQRRIEARLYVGQVHRILELFEAGKLATRVRPTNRARMVEAFRLYLEGYSMGELATHLSISKSTAHDWTSIVSAVVMRALEAPPARGGAAGSGAAGSGVQRGRDG